jgi:hypothetical protein
MSQGLNLEISLLFMHPPPGLSAGLLDKRLGILDQKTRLGNAFAFIEGHRRPKLSFS